jgi:undecaprenyl-diphosphatase
LTFFILLIGLYLAGRFSRNNYLQSMVILWLVADFVAFLFVQILKTLVRRPRPVGEWGKMYRYNDPHSFPSGHSARGGVLSAISVLLAAPVLTPIGMVIGALWGLMIAVSRVLLGVHYPTDTAFGYLLGITAGLAVVSILL